RPVSASNVTGPTNSRAARVSTTSTVAPSSVRSRASCAALYAAIPPATPRMTRRPCQGRRGASAPGIGWLRALAAPLDEPELDVPGGERFERARRQLLLQAGGHRVPRQRVQLARVLGRDQHTQVLAPRVARGL